MDEPKRTSDPIQIFNVTQTPTGWERIIAAVTKAIVCLTVTVSGAWLLANRIEIPAPAWGLASLIIIGTFGLEDLYKRLKNGKT